MRQRILTAIGILAIVGSLMSLSVAGQGPLPPNQTAKPSFNNFGRSGDNYELLEGVMTSSPSGSTQGVYVDFSTFEEASIQTVGNNAEMPLSGVYLNTIVKSGGNDFHGGAFGARKW